MNDWKHRVRTESRVGPIDAGFGMVHADTLVATTDDELIADPEGTAVELTVDGKTTSREIADLGLKPGSYDASLRISGGGAEPISESVKLLLVDPARVSRRFGARYGSLEYDLPVVTGRGTTSSWESLWKTGEFADIVVDFERPYKFLLWRGMSYAPSWAMDNVMTSLFFAETVEPGRFRDCCEMMSDRECRYSHARIIHSSDARVVIHWRYALADSDYTICRDQWADEVFYVYPDGVAVRNVTVYMDPDDPSAWIESQDDGRRIPCSMLDGIEGKRTFNDMEFITVNPPGASSDDGMPPDALTIMDCDGFDRTYTWPDPVESEEWPVPTLREYVFRMNYKGRPGVFVASPGKGVKISLQKNTGMRFEAGARVQDDRWIEVPDLPSNFADHIHWPITRGCGTTPLTDPAAYDDRPTHAFLGHASNAPLEVRENGESTWIWFCGIAPDNDDALRERVRAWTAPAHIEGAQYDVRQGAYVVDGRRGSVVDLTVTASSRRVVRPTLILLGWEKTDVQVLVNGEPVRDAPVGLERTLGLSQTVITLRESLLPGTTIQIRQG